MSCQSSAMFQMFAPSPILSLLIDKIKQDLPLTLEDIMLAKHQNLAL